LEPRSELNFASLFVEGGKLAESKGKERKKRKKSGGKRKHRCSSLSLCPLEGERRGRRERILLQRTRFHTHHGT
jgi:hypothetical protein